MRLLELYVWEPSNKVKAWFFALKVRKFVLNFSRFPKGSNLMSIVRITMQEEMFSGLNFSSACTHGIDYITKNQV